MGIIVVPGSIPMAGPSSPAVGTPRNSSRFFGGANVPRDVNRRRRSVYEMLRRMGTPILVKHRFNEHDVKEGVAQKSATFDDIYEQSRNHEDMSYGVGYVSVELSDNEWYAPNSNTLVVSNTSPGAGYTQAPKYRGFGPGNLTWIIEPDAAQDFYKATVGGPIFKVQTAKAIAPWWPDINDNDLLVNVTVGANNSILDTHERFEAKSVNPVSMRGQDKRGRKEYGESFGNTHVVNQTFEMALIPQNDVIYEVDTDR